MANTLLTINMITREAVRLWKNTNAFMRNLDTQYDDQYARTGAKIGSQLRIRLPVDLTVRHGTAASFQDVAQQFTTLTMATQDGVDMSFPSIDLTLSIDDFAELYLAPSINNLAGDVATGVMAGAEGGVCNYIDNEAASAIITPSNNTFLVANAILDTQSAPTMNHRVVTNPFTDARVAGALAGLFNPATEISEQYRSGGMKNALGLDWMKDQTVILHKSGTFSAGTVFGAGQTGTAITTNSITGTLAKGDIITFASVNGVNRITKQSYGQLRQFVVVNAVATSGTSITIYPALIPAGPGGVQVQYQTVDISPAIQPPSCLSARPIRPIARTSCSCLKRSRWRRPTSKSRPTFKRRGTSSTVFRCGWCANTSSGLTRLAHVSTWCGARSGYDPSGVWLSLTLCDEKRRLHL